uniref:Pentacotripeptide-repeat region of PRORP domain-containing protein n=1 Tax=Arundo donax TaxID=35708 RepID=A0A0A9DBC5_ARUDO
MWKMILEMVRNPICVVTPTELSEVIRMLGNAKMISKAIAIFYQIKARKCQPTAQAYNSMIIMLMHEGQYEKVHELYNEMSNEGHCFPDTVTYSALISAFCKLNRRDSAIQLLNEMKENRMQPTAKIYTMPIALFFKLDDVHGALSLFEEMKYQYCRPDLFTYTELIRGLG